MRTIQRLLACRKGNVAVMFGLIAIPLFGLAGAAIDYSQAARTRGSLQEAIDAGALAGTRLLNVQTEAEARRQAEAMVRANLPANLRNVPLTVEVVNNGQSMRISTSTTVQTSILQVIGQNSIPVAATTTAMAPAYRKIELVLALDNTGSMAQSGKIQALRSATLELLTLLENSGRRAGDVRVGIVPFTTFVRVDANTYRNASWLKNESNTNASWYTNASNWNGCIFDRDQNYNVVAGAPTSNAANFVRANCNFNSSNNLTTLQPLTSDFSVLRNVVNAMTPAGNTNVTMGVVWGWQLLTGVAPFNQSTGPTTTDTDRWLVVLTDGDNTQDRFSSNQSSIDSRTQAACNNLRSQDNTIRVMTVRVIAGNANLLRSCASNSNYYYEVSNSSQLVDVFRRIAWEITALRLTN